jgi:hypothetical protein
MKIKIIRAFSAKQQLNPYEPIDSFCSVEIEYDDKKLPETTNKAEYLLAQSEGLDKIVRGEVRKTLTAIRAKNKPPDTKKSRDAGRDAAEQDAGNVELPEN